MDTVDEIYNLIVNEPGIHFREIMNKLEKQIGVVSYHINRLEKDNMIVSIRHRNAKLFFDMSWEDRLEEIKYLISNFEEADSQIDYTCS